MKAAGLALLLGAALLGARVSLAGPWLPPGDLGLRHELQLLADAGIVRTPVTSWPVSWGDVSRDLEAASATVEFDDDDIALAFQRVRREARRRTWSGEAEPVLAAAGASHADEIRGFESVPREDVEVRAGIDWTGERYAARLQVTAVANPDDGDRFRPDGSYVGVHLGNVMVSAGYMEKWWGPGYAGSLILSTNARPIPSLTIERNYSDAFESRWLSWLGPWRASFQAGRLEGDRKDHPHAHFMALRVTVRPTPSLELGLSRTAQLCGNGRSCTARTYWDMIVGNDNDLAIERQPGNQLAGFDGRWSAARWLPLAAYAQAVGEDEAGFLPAKYLALAGVETWGTTGRWTWRGYAEWASTSCDALSEPIFGCAYESEIYTDGYRYRGRAIGHAFDRDGRGWTVGAILRLDDWTVTARCRDVDLNRAAGGPNHSLAPLGGELRSFEATVSRSTRYGTVRVSVGHDDVTGVGLAMREGARGFLEWRNEI